MNTNRKSQWAAVCRWGGRGLGGLLSLVVALVAIGEGVPNVLAQPGRVQVGLAALVSLLIGYWIGWRWELVGGLIATGGWISFIFSVVPSLHAIQGFLLLLAIPGVLYLLSNGLRR